MSESPYQRPRRSRRAERAEHIYSAREFSSVDMESAPQQRIYSFTPNEEPEQSDWRRYTPNEEAQSWSDYTPNEEAQSWEGYTPNEEAAQPDYSVYYSRESAEHEAIAEPAFAPPPKMDQYLLEDNVWADEEPDENVAHNVYRTREADWADEGERFDVLAESELGYQVREDAAPSRKRRHTLRNLLIIALALAMLGGGVWLFREPLLKAVGMSELLAEPTEEPFTAVVTPEPVKAYDAAAKVAISDGARAAISHLSGTVEMDNYAVTDKHIVTRNLRSNGTYDFYLFTAAEGRLLCYFEGLGPLDMMPQEGGGFYVSQSPYLVSSTGSALIRTADIEAQLGETVFLHPLYRGWAVVESEADGSANYVNLSGQLISTLWFARTFPFTGEHTLAYVDTGAMGGDARYLLYVLSEDGSMSRWLTADDMSDTVVSALGMAYMADGSLYHLPDTSKPLLASSEIHAYLDCDAMVVRDDASGKYGLFVHGEQHYDFAYDSIKPLDSDITWAQKTLSGAGGSLTVHAVSAAGYPQPLSHSFVLEKNGQREYVALSTQSSYTIRLDGEF